MQFSGVKAAFSFFVEYRHCLMNLIIMNYSSFAFLGTYLSLLLFLISAVVIILVVLRPFNGSLGSDS